MSATQDEVIRETVGMDSSGSMVSLLNKSEIDQQIATAHKFPRSLQRFRREALQMVTLNESIAEQCIYALPRDGKVIEGPSARFAEVVASAWGNCRAGARVVDDRGDFVTAQGVFHDLERNVAITYEVQRRIVDRQGRRFKPDMIGVTANAACSIALRNAVLKGVPKAFWDDMYNEARRVVMGDVQTLANRRAAAVAEFQRFGVSAEQLCAKLGVPGLADVGLEQLVALRGLLTAIKDGDTTAEAAFGDATTSAAGAAVAPGGDQKRADLPPYPADKYSAQLPKWWDQIKAGASAEALISKLLTRNTFTAEQLDEIRNPPRDEADEAGAAGQEAQP